MSGGSNPPAGSGPDREPDPARDMGSREGDPDVSAYPVASSGEPSDRKRIVEEYGRLRAYYRDRGSEHRDLQRWLNQARMGVNYDVYLARGAWFTVVAVLVGALAGIVTTVLLSEFGVVAGLSNPLAYRGDLTRYIGRNRTLFVGAALTVVFAAAIAAVVWYSWYFYPRSVASKRRRKIDVTLPHAIVFMYALSHGGMDLTEVLRLLSKQQGNYGEVANEFEMVIRDVDLFGNDIYTALRNARNLTPSDNLEQLLDDLLSVLDAGGDVPTFFAEQSDTYLDDAREEQETFLETLAILSEVFIAGFVASPLFFIVILIVMSLIGARTLPQLTALVYLVLPLGMVGFLVLIDTLSEPYRVSGVRAALEDPNEDLWKPSGSVVTELLRDGFEPVLAPFGAGRDARGVPESAAVAVDRDVSRLTAYLRSRRERVANELFADPLRSIRRTPLQSLVITVPLAIAAVVAMLASGTVEPTVAAVLADPVRTTSLLAVVPLLILAVPLSAFYELKARREKRIGRRFPDALNVLSSANRMGIKFTDALALVSKWSSGPLAEELRYVRNDITWNFDVSRALLELSDRLASPPLSRTVSLIAEAARSSSDMAHVLSVAAEDTRNRFKMERRRRNELSAYIAVVVIGFLVYLLVVVLLDASYLDPIQAVGPTTADPGDRSLPLSLQNVPVDAYRTMFFHTALIQGFGVGLLAGKLANDTILSGLKYGIGLVLVSVLVFLFI